VRVNILQIKITRLHVLLFRKEFLVMIAAKFVMVLQDTSALNVIHRLPKPLKQTQIF